MARLKTSNIKRPYNLFRIVWNREFLNWIWHQIDKIILGIIADDLKVRPPAQYTCSLNIPIVWSIGFSKGWRHKPRSKKRTQMAVVEPSRTNHVKKISHSVVPSWKKENLNTRLILFAWELYGFCLVTYITTYTACTAHETLFRTTSRFSTSLKFVQKTR